MDRVGHAMPDVSGRCLRFAEPIYPSTDRENAMPEEENNDEGAQIEDDPKEVGYAISGDGEADAVPAKAAQPVKAIEDDPKEVGYAITSE